jgi:ApbE superfamily uncharacterized protein (UPF0280 family)
MFVSFGEADAVEVVPATAAIAAASAPTTIHRFLMLPPFPSMTDS